MILLGDSLGESDRAVVVAVLAVRVVQVAVDEVVDVVAVGNRLVTAAGAVDVGGVVTAAAVIRGAVGGVRRVDVEAVLVDVVLVRVVQVAVVEVVHVVAVLHRDVTAVRAVGVVVILVLVAAHFVSSSSAACSNTPWTSSATWWSASE